jgi:hypothetical protein
MRSGRTPSRIGITLVAPVLSAVVTVTIKPFLTHTDNLLPNGGFEMNGWNWNIPDAAAFAKIATDRAFEGKQSLFIEDTSVTSGSNVSSSYVAVSADRRYVLTGRFMQVSGSGCGIYFKFYDSGGNPTAPTSGAEIQKNILPSEKPPGTPLSWEPFSLEAQAPENAGFLVVWIHSYNSSTATLYLDDLVLSTR